MPLAGRVVVIFPDFAAEQNLANEFLQITLRRTEYRLITGRDQNRFHIQVLVHFRQTKALLVIGQVKKICRSKNLRLPSMAVVAFSLT
jgi:hypothetical protein